MKLPNGEQAIIDERKVREYLLSPSHPVGRFKLKFFAGIGFGPDNWRPFIAALAELAEKGEARIAEEGEFGQKYSVSGLLAGLRLSSLNASNLIVDGRRTTLSGPRSTSIADV